MRTGDYLSEADFCCQFLAYDLRVYSAKLRNSLEIHLEVPVESERADLTVGRNNDELLVIEAKLSKDPWNRDVVEQAFGYARGRFRYFATCNMTWLVLFSTSSEPFVSAIAVIHLTDDWTEELFSWISKPSPPRHLYSMLAAEGVLRLEDAKTFQALLEMELEESGDLPKIPEPGFRLVADAGPEKFALGEPLQPDQPYPRIVGRYWEVDGKGGAKERRVELQKRGYKVRVQRISGGRWTDFDVDQTEL